MKTEGFYIKKQISPGKPELSKNQNIIYYRPPKGLKIIDNNLIYLQANNNNNNQKQILPINNVILPNQNGQSFISTNDIKYMNQNLQNYNINTIKANEDSKLSNDNMGYSSKSSVKNYPLNNYTNFFIDSNNQKQNQIISNENTKVNINNNSNIIIYTPIVNNINGLPINNNVIINPGLNQQNQQQILANQNVNVIPVMQIQQTPFIPIKKNIMTNGYTSPSKNNIKRDIYQHRYETIQAENRYALDSVKYTQPWTEKKNLDNNNNEDELSENEGYCSKINKDEKRIISSDSNTIDYSTPIKVKNNLNTIYNQDFSENNNLTTPPKNLDVNPPKKHNNVYHSQEKPKIQPFYNYMNNQNPNAFSLESNNNNNISPNITPIKSNQNTQYNNKSLDKIYSTSSLPVNNSNSMNLIPQISKNLFSNTNSNNNNKNISIKSFSHLSKAGTEENGQTKINQDSFVVLPKVNNIENFSIFAVLDGHGPHGHFVSKFVSQNLINNIISNPSIKSLQDIERIYSILKQNNYRLIKQAFISIDYNIRNCNFDVNDSGTTCVLLILLGTHLICANVGDSRAIALYDSNNDPNLSKLNIVPLSIDYKLEIPEERNRIIMAGGSVQKVKDSMGELAGPLRVFKPGKDYPGLAMSRSIGDTIAKNLGVIAEPGIYEYNLNERFKFIIMGSDGIWEFLTNEDAKNIGKVFYLNCEAKDLCEELYNSSLIKWKINDSCVDDITAIVIYF